MLEDGTVFESKGLDGLDPLEFVTDEGEWTFFSKKKKVRKIPLILKLFLIPWSLFCLSAEQVITGLDRAVMTMKKGERALLTIKPEYGFGDGEVKQDLAAVPPCSTLIYEVEMLNFTRVTF